MNIEHAVKFWKPSSERITWVDGSEFHVKIWILNSQGFGTQEEEEGNLFFFLLFVPKLCDWITTRWIPSVGHESWITSHVSAESWSEVTYQRDTMTRRHISNKVDRHIRKRTMKNYPNDHKELSRVNRAKDQV